MISDLEGSFGFELNGTLVTCGIQDGVAIDLLRDGLGLTGTKLCCGGGQCGACVILVDDVPVASCLLPIDKLESRRVTTIEGIGRDGLHPIQRAFIANDALQCGFCTPGFVVEAVAFHNSWRASRSQERPSRDDIERALAGHLCRCGAYDGIAIAVADACEGVFDGVTSVNGRPDAEDKVTGRARYTVDIKKPDMAHGVIVRSTEGHAMILGVDTKALLAIKGVLAYVPFPDVDRVRYVGQPIGAIAAVDEPTARQAAGSVRVTYQVIETVVGIDAALADGAPDLHARGWSPPNSSEGSSFPTLKRGNLRGPLSVASLHRFRARRRIATARSDVDSLLVESVWETQTQVHNALEPHAAVAEWISPDRLEVHASTQMVLGLARRLAERYDLEQDAVNVIAGHVGGAFGGKQGVSTDILAAVELSRACDRPVRVVLGRSEEMTDAGSRPGARLELALTGDLSGLSALAVDAKADGGASAGQVIATFARLAYPGSPRSLLDYDVLSNQPPAKPFRGPGAPMLYFALEQAVDELSERLGTDPITLRQGWSDRSNREQLYRWAGSHSMWTDRLTSSGVGRIRTGVGAAFSTWHYGYDPDTTVTVEKSGRRLVASSATQDMGNGTRTLMRAAVAEVFDLDADSIEVNLGDSRMKHGPASVGSRTAASVHPTTRAAAVLLRTQLRDAAESSLGMDGARADAAGIEHAGEHIGWPDLLDRLPDLAATSVRPEDARGTVVPLPLGDMRFGRGFAEGGHLVEVEVDSRLGVITPTRVAVALAVGTVHSEMTARSQVRGAVIQGLSYALYEERQIDPFSGLNVTSTFDSYRIAGLADTPEEITVEFIDGGFEHVPGGGVGLAEIATVGVAAATANAVAHATGHRSKQMPITPRQMIEALS